MDNDFDFSIFDNAVNTDQFKKDLEEAKANAAVDFPEVPAGDYTVKIKKMEITSTKKDGYPMFTCQMQIIGGDYNKQYLFFNRKIYGNNNSEKWTDAKAIQSVITWLDNLETETVPEFINYSQFNDCVLDIFEECEKFGLTLDVTYDPKAFNPIKINEVYEG